MWVSGRALADAHAAAHDDAVHEGDVGLAVGVDQVVECVLFGEKVLQRRVSRKRRLVEITDVATGAEAAERAFLVDAADRHSQHRVVVSPALQCLCDAADHVERQGVEGLGPVERDAADAAHHFGNDVGFRHRDVHRCSSGKSFIGVAGRRSGCAVFPHENASPAAR